MAPAYSRTLRLISEGYPVQNGIKFTECPENGGLETLKDGGSDELEL